MARTYRDVITRARRIVADNDAAVYRYTEESLLDAVNDALLEIRRIRPDLFFDDQFVVTDVAEVDADITAIPIETYYFQSLVYYTAAYQMLRDDEFSVDTRAVNLLNKAASQLLTVNA